MLRSLKFWALWNAFGLLMAVCLILGFRKERTWPGGMWNRYSEPLMFWIDQSLCALGIALVLVGEAFMGARAFFKL